MGDCDLDLGDEANQFWGRVVAFHTRRPEPRPASWYPEKRWYAVLHKFDAWGRHLSTEHWFAGVDRPWGDAPERANVKLDEMVAALGEVEYADIEIRLFRVVIDGCTFGLLDVSQPELGPTFAERVAMEPGNLLFRAPWDGSYDT
jgi:formate hydrogenlyase regulatory protein HycA